MQALLKPRWNLVDNLIGFRKKQEGEMHKLLTYILECLLSMDAELENIREALGTQTTDVKMTDE